MIHQEDSTGIRCPRCGRVSYNPNDVRERYCGHCHRYHDSMYFCLDCGCPTRVAPDGAEVTCMICGGFRMIPEGDDC